MPHKNSACPCGSQESYEACCAPYHKGQAAPTPEILMRSRYTAYALGNIDYILQTMRGKPLHGFDAEQAKKWASSVSWIGLSVLSVEQVGETNGEVEFIARFVEGAYLKAIHEVSVFHLEQGRWFYVDGTLQDSRASQTRLIGRHALCPCGSLRKFKNCHEKIV